jgi:hypothetical protein
LTSILQGSWSPQKTVACYITGACYVGSGATLQCKYCRSNVCCAVLCPNHVYLGWFTITILSYKSAFRALVCVFVRRNFYQARPKGWGLVYKMARLSRRRMGNGFLRFIPLIPVLAAKQGLDCTALHCIKYSVLHCTAQPTHVSPCCKARTGVTFTE